MSGGYACDTMERTPHSVRDSIEVIPTSNSIDSAMYERDQQIYKCSTMRAPTGNNGLTKIYEKKCSFSVAKPSILNCPLPAIPTDADGVIATDSMKLDRVPPMNQRYYFNIFHFLRNKEYYIEFMKINYTFFILISIFPCQQNQYDTSF